MHERESQQDVNNALTFGNHKGATLQLDLLQSLIKKGVTQGFGLVIPLSIVHQIPKGFLALHAPSMILHTEALPNDLPFREGKDLIVDL